MQEDSRVNNKPVYATVFLHFIRLVYTDCYLYTYSHDLTNVWTILWYPLQLCYSYFSIEFYCVYYCFMPYVFTVFCKNFWDPKHVHHNLIYLC